MNLENLSLAKLRVLLTALFPGSQPVWDRTKRVLPNWFGLDSGFYFPSDLCSIVEVWILFHKLSRTSSSCCLLLLLSVVKHWLLRWPLPCFSMSRIAALAWKESQEMLMGLFSWLITREFICYKGHIDFSVVVMEFLPYQLSLCVHYSICNN